MERARIINAVNQMLEYTGHQPDIKCLTNMPTGPLNPVADSALTKKLLDWKPKVTFREGLKRTVD